MFPTRSQEWIALLQRLADRADSVAMRHFRSASLSVVRKPDGSPVTVADLEIECEVDALLRQSVPELGILGEEYGERAGSGTARLIIDPIDATLNFIRGNPVFATLLAVEVQGEVVAGLVSAPALPGRWWAARGGGAWQDGRVIRVSDRDQLAACRLSWGTPADEAVRSRYPGLDALARATRANCEVGDFLQHLRVAEGLGEIAIDFGVAPWDIAALQVIVEEAGGTATAADGRRTLHGGTLVTTNGRVHDRVLAYLHAQPGHLLHGGRVTAVDPFVAAPQRDAP